MSINVISTATRKRVPTSAGTVREIITADDAEAKHVRASIHDIEPNKTLELNSGDRTHLVYVIEGSGANFSFKGEKYPAKKGTGLYLEAGEKAALSKTISLVSGVMDDNSPPITPAIAAGFFSSAITSIPSSSVAVFPSSVCRTSSALARRTRSCRPARRAASNAWRGWPSSCIT